MTAKLIKRGPWSDEVRKHLDPNRPKYSAAVQSIAAFCTARKNPELVFKVLVTHLDDACREADELAHLGLRDVF